MYCLNYKLWIYLWERWFKSVRGCQYKITDDFILIHSGHFSILQNHWPWNLAEVAILFTAGLSLTGYRILQIRCKVFYCCCLNKLCGTRACFLQSGTYTINLINIEQSFICFILIQKCCWMIGQIWLEGIVERFREAFLKAEWGG